MAHARRVINSLLLRVDQAICHGSSPDDDNINSTTTYDGLGTRPALEETPDLNSFVVTMTLTFGITLVPNLQVWE